MNKLNLLIYYLFLLTVLLLVSCAQQLNPVGGPTDNKPPQIIKSEPALYSTNFNTKEIELKFNEFITLKDLNKFLLISPPTKNQPEITASGKRIKIRITDTLLQNTTYQLYLGDAITDIHEGNKLENFNYIFSTGSVIDSLKIKGKVLNASDLSPVEGVNVQIYNSQADSIAYKGLPQYISKTNKNGEFKIEAMAPGNYVVIALLDKNNNYTFENSSDKIGFLNNSLLLSSDTSNNYKDLGELFIFEEIPDKQHIKKTTNTSYGRIELVFNRPLSNPSIKFNYPVLNAVWPYQYFSNRKDTLTLFYNETFNDSISCIISDAKYADTLNLKLFKKTERTAKGQRTVEESKLNLSFSGINNGEILPNKSLSITSNVPLKDELYNKILIQTKKDSIWFELKKINHREYEVLNFRAKEKENYSLFLMPKSFTSITGLSNDSVKLKFKCAETSSFGSFKLIKEEKLKSERLIVELKDDKGNILYKGLFEGKEKLIENLLPGIYSLNIVIDENRDGIWTTGKFSTREKPEKVMVIKDQSIKKRFETEVVLKLQP